MKKKGMILAIFLATGVILQAQDRLTQYQVRNAIDVRTPIMNDSINPKGEKYATKMLLQTPVVLELPDAPMQTLAVDTAGFLKLTKAEKDSKIYLVKTQIRAERFVKGKLKVTSPVRWEAFIDGVSKHKKKMPKIASLLPLPMRLLSIWNRNEITKLHSNFFLLPKIKLYLR